MTQIGVYHLIDKWVVFKFDWTGILKCMCKKKEKKDPKMMVICHHATLRMLLWLHVYKGGFSSGFWRLFEKRTVLGVVSLISYDLYTDLNLRNGITTERVLRQLPDTMDVPYNALFPLSIIFDTTANWLCLEKKNCLWPYSTVQWSLSVQMTIAVGSPQYVIWGPSSFLSEMCCVLLSVWVTACKH